MLAPAPGDQLATTGGQHVLDAVGLGPVGEGDDVAVGRPEHVDGRAVCMAGRAPGVDENTEPSEPHRERPDEMVGNPAIEVCDPPANARAHPSSCHAYRAPHWFGPLDDSVVVGCI